MPKFDDYASAGELDGDELCLIKQGSDTKKIRISDIALISGYGMRWDSVNDVMTPGIASAGVFYPFEVSNFPVQEKMRRCVMNASNVVQYYLDPDDSTKKTNGESANIDGTDGQVQVEVSLFYYLIETDGNYKYFLVGERPFSLTLSDSSVKTAKHHEWFEEGGTLSDKKYIGAFEGVLYDDSAGSYIDGDGAGQYAAGDKVHSIEGYKPLTYETRATFRTACAVDGDYHQMGYWAHEAIMLLFLTEYQTWDSQTALPGYTEDASYVFADDVCKTGITKTLGNKSGSISWNDADNSLRCTEDQGALIVANSYRGIENFYGHIWKWVDGFNVQFVGSPLTDAAVYVCNNPANFTDDTSTNYTDLGIDLPLASGYQTDLHDGTLLPKTASGGSSSTYICDYYYASSGAGWRVLRSGGRLYYGAYAGFASRYANNASSFRTSSIGGRSAA